MQFDKVVRPEIQALSAYVPGRSIEEIRQKYGIERVVKMASNENALGVSPLVQRAVVEHAAELFRYPASGNPRLVNALSTFYDVPRSHIVVGNGSDEILDCLIRMLVVPGKENIVCFRPCFSIYPIQAQIAGIEVRRERVNADFSFDFDKLFALVDENTRLVFITTPDNPSGYCPRPEEVKKFALRLPENCLLVIDEAYMDFAAEEGETEADWSLLAKGELPENAVVVRTFSKSFALAGIRLGIGFFPEELAAYYWRMRLPFSVNILAEEAGMAALADGWFREATLGLVRSGRRFLTESLQALGCTVAPSKSNFVMFHLPEGTQKSAREVYETLLSQGLIVRALTGSYELPDWIRVSVGTEEENALFLRLLKACLE